MPRRTTKRKAKVENICVKTLKNVKDKSLQKEFGTSKVRIGEEVVHRKSGRRRVARDVFLVFEEESNLSNKKRTNKPAKPKFGHLQVDASLRQKGLLRDIKNEPKCYINASNINTTISHNAPILNNLKILDKKKLLNTEKNRFSSCGKVPARKKINNITSSVAILESERCPFDDTKSVARVNPIFLWVKQEDTRIVEVRCEDYDKRNRIRITRTPNGWRSIPRSDPSTSRVLKFNPTPLMKVKRECNHENEFSIPNSFTKKVANGIDSAIICNVDTMCNKISIKNLQSKIKKSKKFRLEKTVRKFTKKTAKSKFVVNNEALATNLNLPFSTKSSDIYDLQVQINSKIGNSNKDQTNESPIITKNSVQDISVGVVNSNYQMLESNPSLSICTLDSNSTYQTLEEELSFHLCPKTGLFFPSKEYDIESYENIMECHKHCFHIPNKEEFSSIGKSCTEKKIVSEENVESLEAKTKNLKDLLDEADLFQNCGDNTNSAADLVDNLVKTSCEDNLIQANEVIKLNTDQMLPMNETNELVAQLIANVSEPPKCLSFNEAGEIEDLSEDNFQQNTFIESFEKQPGTIRDTQVILYSTSNIVESCMSPNKISLCENLEPVQKISDTNTSKLQQLCPSEESPKDLSYKKREEVCPQSDSRSQCVVTSSSDVIKSPQREVSTSLVSPSEALKNIILEQFMKLNALTTLHQMETTDSNIENVCTGQTVRSNNIETVVIDDDGSDNEEQEPIKKRIRHQKHKVICQSKLMIDKDPDPLTQLRLLIKNTQWKVPDPILVPKDRLSAVLASPAREIPLLITTRPELRLPEAFAYPEIIQNPNILVISMAQLEAILKNEIGKTSNMKSSTIQQLPEELVGQLNNRVIGLQLHNPEQQFPHTPNYAKNVSTNSDINLPVNSTKLSTSREYDTILQTDSNSSDINAAAMTVLNQMLWMPYFGQISQKIEKYGKDPMAQQKTFLNSSPSFSSEFNGITHLEKPEIRQTENSVLNEGWQSFQQQFKTNEELSVFQKIVRNQMQSVLQLSQFPDNSAKHIASVVPENTTFSVDKSKVECPSSLNERRKQKQVLFKQNQINTSLCKNQTNKFCQNMSPEKSYNLRSSVAGRHSIELKKYSYNNQRHISDNKPRLTCKSLSNLLNPEHIAAPSGQNTAGFINGNNYNTLVAGDTERKGMFLANPSIAPQSQKSCGNIVVNIASFNEIGKEKPKLQEQNSLNNDVTALTADPNVALWHPLFGSNTKAAYSSPWHWTTVTAAGE